MYAGRPRGRVVGLPRSIHHIVNSSMRHTVSDGQDIDGPNVQSLHKVGWKDKLVPYSNHSRFDHISLQQPNCLQGLLFQPIRHGYSDCFVDDACQLPDPLVTDLHILRFLIIFTQPGPAEGHFPSTYLESLGKMGRMAVTHFSKIRWHHRDLSPFGELYSDLIRYAPK